MILVDVRLLESGLLMRFRDAGLESKFVNGFAADDVLHSDADALGSACRHNVHGRDAVASEVLDGDLGADPLGSDIENLAPDGLERLIYGKSALWARDFFLVRDLGFGLRRGDLVACLVGHALD